MNNINLFFLQTRISSTYKEGVNKFLKGIFLELKARKTTNSEESNPATF